MNIVNINPFLRVQRRFPTEAKDLSVQMDKSYVDIAGAVNDRTIGLFPTTKAAITGEAWFLTANEKQQTFRQVYTFSGPANPITITHNLDTSQISLFTKIYGTFVNTSTGIYYPLPYVDVALVTNQVSVIVNSTQIVITAGAGAPAISNGLVVLEWLSRAPSLKTA